MRTHVAAGDLPQCRSGRLVAQQRPYSWSLCLVPGRMRPDCVTSVYKHIYQTSAVAETILLNLPRQITVLFVLISGDQIHRDDQAGGIVFKVQT